MDKKYPIPQKYQDKIAALTYEPPDGYFVYTKNGWCCGDNGLHCIAEDTLKEAKEQMRSVIPCNCNDCANGTMTWGNL